MDKFIKALNQKFADNQAAFTDAGLPFVKTIDKFRNQPLNPEAFEYFELPAIFVNRSIQWVKEGKYYTGLMTVEFHVVQDATWPTESFSSTIDDGLKQYIFLNIVRALLDDFESENTSKLQRSTETPVDADVSIYDVISYTCNYYEPLPAGKQYIDAAGDNLNLTKNLYQHIPE